jgi:hypothetical protein
MSGDCLILGSILTRGVLGAGGEFLELPEPIPGFHVVASAPLVGLDAYLVTATPPTTFFGADTYYYVFPDEGTAQALIGYADGNFSPVFSD